MNRSLVLVSTARESSTRCKNKMLRKFNGTTLFDIHMKTLQKVKKRNKGVFDDIVIAISDYDKKLWKKAEEYDIKIDNRSIKSVTTAKTMYEIYDFLENHDENYMMWLNPSCPFISPNTILYFGRYFKDNNMKSLHVVKQNNNWFWKEGENKPLNIYDVKNTETQDTQQIYESLHAFHIHNIKYILENNKSWSYEENDPYLYKLDEDSIEFFDIDTDKDFRIARRLWKTRV